MAIKITGSTGLVTVANVASLRAVPKTFIMAFEPEKPADETAVRILAQQMTNADYTLPGINGWALYLKDSKVNLVMQGAASIVSLDLEEYRRRGERQEFSYTGFRATATTLELFINGEFTSAIMLSPLASNTGALKLGSNGSAAALGCLASASWWSEGLTDAEIAHFGHVFADIDGDEPGLVSAWPMKELSGTTVDDIKDTAPGALSGDYEWDSLPLNPVGTADSVLTINIAFLRKFFSGGGIRLLQGVHVDLPLCDVFPASAAANKEWSGPYISLSIGSATPRGKSAYGENFERYEYEDYQLVVYITVPRAGAQSAGMTGDAAGFYATKIADAVKALYDSNNVWQLAPKGVEAVHAQSPVTITQNALVETRRVNMSCHIRKIISGVNT